MQRGNACLCELARADGDLSRFALCVIDCTVRWGCPGLQSTNKARIASVHKVNKLAHRVHPTPSHTRMIEVILFCKKNMIKAMLLVR